MSFYDIPILGGIFRGIASADQNGVVDNQSAEQNAGARATVGATSMLPGAINTYAPQQNPGVTALIGQNIAAGAGVQRAANAQNTAANPGLNTQQQNMSMFGNMAQNGSQAAQQQLTQGQQQQQAQLNSQALSTGGMSPAQRAAAMGQTNAVQGQNNLASQQQLQAQGQLAGQQLLGQAAGQYGNSVNNAYSAAQQGQTAAAAARNSALGTQGQYLLGQQNLNQNYLNTLGDINNAAYQNSNNYQNQQRQTLAQGASGIGSLFAGLLM